jgi:hypothetical protein
LDGAGIMPALSFFGRRFQPLATLAARSSLQINNNCELIRRMRDVSSSSIQSRMPACFRRFRTLAASASGAPENACNLEKYFAK